jgi:hypothetical protein
MKRLISILIVIVSLTLPFQSVHAFDNEASRKIDFCSSLSNMAKEIMTLRQAGLSKEDTTELLMSGLSRFDLDDIEEVKDMTTFLISTVYMYPIVPSPMNIHSIEFMGEIIFDNCIEELIEEKDFLE